jgi:hypothetical protein
MIPKKASQVVYATGSPKHNVQKAFSGGKRNKKRASPNCSKKTSPKFKKKASPKGTQYYCTILIPGYLLDICKIFHAYCFWNGQHDLQNVLEFYL